MARRSAPPASGPSFIPHPSQRRVAMADQGGPDQSAFSRFIQTQIFSPDKLPGNLSILTGAGMFIGGIIAVRTWGDLMVPA